MQASFFFCCRSGCEVQVRMPESLARPTIKAQMWACELRLNGSYLVRIGAIGGSKYQFTPARATFSRNGAFAVKVPQQLVPVAEGSKSTNKYSAVSDQWGRNIHSKPAPAAQPARTLEDDPVVQL